MNSVSLDHTERAHRPQWLWLVETLVVVGVLAFGYFAIIVDADTLPDTVASSTADPLFDLVR